MECFYRIHNYLLKNIQSPVRRVLMDEIDWTKRLIGIKGSRGVGKTTFLLQIAKEHFGEKNRQCLYINFNNFYFAGNSLIDFAKQFFNDGGKTLLLDQMFKYENWSSELRECYDTLPDLQIIFTGSSVMRLEEENADLNGIITVYNLRGFSFREYLFLESGQNFPTYTLNQLVENHSSIAQSITEKINPLNYFKDYLHHGYYPFYLENRNYSENLLKTMNMMLEVDILLIKKIDIKYLSKIRKLLLIILETAPDTLNISQLSDEIETSRLTVMNYIKYLKDARLLNLLYTEGESFPKKPKMLYLQNTNLMHALSFIKENKEGEGKTFLFNSLHATHTVNLGKKNSDFLVNKSIAVKYLKNEKIKKNSNLNVIFAVDDLLLGNENRIPLWMFGFLY